MRLLAFLCVSVFFLGCSGLERSEKEKIRKRNCKGEMVYRNQKDVFFPITTPRLSPKPDYPWNDQAQLPRITKEFFRCKGSSLNPPYVDTSNAEVTTYSDCEGGVRHGLPIIHGREGVYPVLIDLLNFVQKQTGKKVIITSGHRCPSHNKYVDNSKENRVSKYQIGAAVDFYVQGLEENPLEVVELLMSYYQQCPVYPNISEYEVFTRYEKADSFVSTKPWMNKEVYIKMHQKNEGRNFDNSHPYPYITIQVRFDKLKAEKVVYDWNRAQNYSKGF